MNEPTPTLTPWAPENKYRHERRHEVPSRPLPTDAAELAKMLLVCADLNTSEVQMLERAAVLNDFSDRLWSPRPSYEGYNWYSKLGRIVNVQIWITTPDEGPANPARQLTLAEADHFPCPRPEKITVELLVHRFDGQTEKIELDTDLAFTDTTGVGPEEVGLTIARNGKVSIHEAADRLFDGHYVENTDDPNRDTPETQEHEYKMLCMDVVMSMLGTPEGVRAARIEELTCMYLRPKLKRDEHITITLTRLTRPTVVIQKIDPPGPVQPAR